MEDQFLYDINQNIGIVYKICNVYITADKNERDDLFQEIMYQLWKSYPHFKGKSKFSTWMYRVALNTAIMQLKHTKRIVDNEKLNLSHIRIPESNDQTDEDDQIQQLYRMIGTLSKIDKAIILLALEEHGYEEIATMTGLTKSNISVRLVRIKRILKEKLQNH